MSSYLYLSRCLTSISISFLLCSLYVLLCGGRGGGSYKGRDRLFESPGPSATVTAANDGAVAMPAMTAMTDVRHATKMQHHFLSPAPRAVRYTLYQVP